MDEQNGVICAYILDGKGGAREIGLEEVRTWQPEMGVLWVHLNRRSEPARRWLETESSLDPLVCQALLAEETRPRSMVVGEDLLAILRGVNMNPGADPEDMVSIRMSIDANRIITLRLLKVMAIQDIRDRIAVGKGPKNSGDFLVQLTGSLVDRMGPVLTDLDDDIDGLEEEILETTSYAELRAKLGGLRRQAIALRRYVAPQRDAMNRLYIERLSWLTDSHRAQLRETTDRVTRYVEDLDEARDHAAVAQDELVTRLSERMNKTMYVLSLVAAIFLPLGLLTGLLGINVGGIPGGDNPWAFAMVCAFLGLIACGQLIVFRKLHWF